MITFNLGDPLIFILLVVAGGIVVAGFGLFIVQCVDWGIEYNRQKQEMKRVKQEREKLQREREQHERESR